MTDPFKINPNNFNISKQERVLRKSVVDDSFNQYNSSICLSDELNNATTFEDLKTFVGRYDLNLLLHLTVSKISSFSPANFNDFLQYLDETNILLSCLWPETAASINNNSTKHNKVSLLLTVESLLFDFFEQFRAAIRAKGEALLVQLIKKFFLEVLDLVDCDNINKCVTPCSPEFNPYKNLFTNLKLKTGSNFEIFLNEKIKKHKLKISRDELKTLYAKSIESLTPEELECLLSGYKSTKIIKFISDLFNSLFGDSSTDTSVENVVNDIFNNFNDLVDVIPASSELTPVNPCGKISVEGVARAQLIRNGKTPEEADLVIAQTISDSRLKLQTIAVFINNNPFFVDPNINQNSDIVKSIVKKSLDNIFDGINSYKISSERIYENILINQVGELNIAYFWTVKPNIINLNIPDNINLYLNNQIKIIEDNSFFTDPLFLLTNSNSNFYKKYNLESKIKKDNFTITYNDNDINVFSGNEKIFNISKTQIKDIELNINLPILNENIEQYVLTTNRDDVHNLLSNQNDNLLTQYFNIDVEKLSSDVYKNISDYIQKDIGKLFYFEQYNNENRDVLNKLKFSDLDYFNLEIVKNRIKEKINV